VKERHEGTQQLVISFNSGKGIMGWDSKNYLRSSYDHYVCLNMRLIRSQFYKTFLSAIY